MSSAVINNCHWFYMKSFQVLCKLSSTENPETKSCRCISQWKTCFVPKFCIASLHNKTSECEIPKPVDNYSLIKWAQLLLGTLPWTRNVSMKYSKGLWQQLFPFPSKNLETPLYNKHVSHRQSNQLCIGFYFSVTITKRAAWGKRRNCSGFVLL